MPEGPEVETEKLHEAIHEELEKEGGRFLKTIALTTAMLAVLAALASLRAGATVNEALVLKTEASIFQAKASDQWSYYQAKGIKGAVAEASRTSFEAAGKPTPDRFAEKAARYEHEQSEIQAEAQKLEKERDEKTAEADHLLHSHHHFAVSVAFFQVAIALGAVAALTRNRLVWLGSLAIGATGLASFALAFL
jgi:hypothetical protein